MVPKPTYYCNMLYEKIKTMKFGAARPSFLCMAFKSVQGRGLRRRPAGGPGAAADFRFQYCRVAEIAFQISKF